MARTYKASIEITEDILAMNVGDTLDLEIEMPPMNKKPRGVLAGIALEEMTDEQLKREIINANSVLYKAVQRGASDETVAANQARADAARAEKEKRTGAKVKPVEPADDLFDEVVETVDEISDEI